MGLSKRQRIGSLILVLIFVIIHIYNFLLYPVIFKNHATYSISDLYIHYCDSVFLTNKHNSLIVKANIEDTVVYHSFDPNLVDSSKLARFNLPQKLVSNWINYRIKGGRFYKCADLEKIYGMRPEILDSLMIYCHLTKTPEPGRFITSNPRENHSGKYTRENIRIEMVNINTDDSLAFKRLKGIGPVLSKRIIKYRNRLGGFHDLAQLTEVYGVEDSVLSINKSMLTVQGPLDKININECGFKELIRHYYFDKPTTNAILKYRKQHGIFDSIQQVKNIRIINDSIYNRIIPYLEI